ncbi:MAG: DUF4388 domain-containing protein [Alphaproteobacteria bacterium]|nr:DUF4388 domain-containing protein [Alphaproteobacteria bacterium]
MADVLSGDLRAIQVVSVLQLVESEGLTGRLHLGVDAVDFLGGQPVSVTTGSYDGVEAIRRLVERRVGAFRFDQDAAVDGEPIGSVMSLVMQALRVQDDWLQLRARCLTHPHDKPRPPRSTLLPLWSALDGRRTLAEAVVTAGASVALVVDDIKDALDRGWLFDASSPDEARAARAELGEDALEEPDAPVVDAYEDEAPEPSSIDREIVAEVPAPPPTQPYHALSYAECMERAQDLLEAEQWLAAEPLLLRALEVRPNDRVVGLVLHRVQAVLARLHPERTPHFDHAAGRSP